MRFSFDNVTKPFADEPFPVSLSSSIQVRVSVGDSGAFSFNRGFRNTEGSAACDDHEPRGP